MRFLVGQLLPVIRWDNFFILITALQYSGSQFSIDLYVSKDFVCTSESVQHKKMDQGKEGDS